MKKLLVLCLALIGCAGSTTETVDVEVDINTVHVPPVKHSIPSQYDDGQEPSLDGKDCEIIQKVYADNCILYVIRCTDGTIDIDSECGPPYVPAWEWHHDPVINKESNQN